MKFFMAAASHSYDFHTDLEAYIDASAAYIVAKETVKDKHKESQGQHFHVAVEMTDKQYDSYRNTILKKKYGLRGKATADKPRQYGVVKNVRDETKFLQYTVKNQNIIYRNIDLKTIQDYISKSYVKEEKKQFQEELMDLLSSYDSSHFFHLRTQNLVYNQGLPDVEPEEIIDVGKIQTEILSFNMMNSLTPLSRNKLQYYTNLFLQYHFHPRYDFLYQIVQIINNGKVYI